VIVALIAALDEAGGIGKDGGLPWRLSADLRQFKALTIGHHLILGRKTYASIGRPLPGRTLIVVTRNPAFAAPGCLLAASLEQALALAGQRGESEAFIGGGSQVFAQAMPLADRLYLTRVHTLAACDTFFPSVDWAAWQETARQEHPADEQNEFAFTFMRLERRRPDRFLKPVRSCGCGDRSRPMPLFW